MESDNEKGVKTMTVETTVQKWGNSLAVRIPSAFAERLAIHQGSKIEINVVNDREISLIPKKKVPVLEELLAEITPENRHTEINFGTEGNELI
ncbi:AbrB/MazE/SpoVT family DNA-binding domain-containing protein [Sporosarcina cascadiensis]|uniref:AbrB/MazE/SpoVT family DNA-binding domain-containing protein n=1 Tax=Sporosarcina cascadiensis TaxID=2660747 RepID=UPI00129BE56B|nr:AbrB/MazE/SpoVT family DNA-binding domain-containing protein [Sporosarcina cascadiensis]